SVIERQVLPNPGHCVECNTGTVYDSCHRRAICPSVFCLEKVQAQRLLAQHICFRLNDYSRRIDLFCSRNLSCQITPNNFAYSFKRSSSGWSSVTRQLMASSLHTCMRWAVPSFSEIVRTAVDSALRTIAFLTCITSQSLSVIPSSSEIPFVPIRHKSALISESWFTTDEPVHI